MLREKGDFAGALEPARRAVQLSPNETLGWQVLGQAQEGIGLVEDAESSLRQAIALAPHNSDANWALGNLLVRADKVKEALPFFEMAGQMNASLYPGAFDVLWQVTNKQTSMLSSIVRERYQAKVLLAQFLAEQGQLEDAIQIFNDLDREKARQDPISVQLLNTLINQKKMLLARSTWLRLVGGESQTGEAQIWNGSFEADLMRPLSQFDWILSESKFARCTIDSNRGHTGSRSLKIGFLGKDTTSLTSEVFQVIVVKPGQRYRLEAFVRTANLVTPEGPRIAVKADSNVIATSDPVENGTREWQRLTLEFVGPKETTVTSVGFIRTPKYAYDEPTSGTIWLDDFSLLEMGGV